MTPPSWQKERVNVLVLTDIVKAALYASAALLSYIECFILILHFYLPVKKFLVLRGQSQTLLTVFSYYHAYY